jgi:hypothetical protein
MSWARPDEVRITHSSGHVTQVEARRRGHLRPARAMAMLMLKSKLYAAPTGPKEIPMGEVRVYDFSRYDQDYWNRGDADDVIAQAARQLEVELAAAIDKGKCPQNRESDKG